MMKDNEVTVYDISSPGGTGRYSAASSGSTMRSVDSPTKMIIPSSISHHVLMPVGLDLEIDDMDNYQDIRIELNATGHNLVSVSNCLMPTSSRSLMFIMNLLLLCL